MTAVAHVWVHQGVDALCFLHGETLTPPAPGDPGFGIQAFGTSTFGVA